MISKFKYLFVHLKNIIPLYVLLLQDIHTLFWLLFSKSSRKNQTTFLINHRNWGFGHQIIELRYARKLSKKNNTTILTTCNFGNSFLHQKMTDRYIKTVKFNFEFNYDISSFYLAKFRQHKDIGGSPNELSYTLSVQYRFQHKLSKFSNESYKRIYESFPKHDFSDLPTFFNISEEYRLFKTLKNIGIDPDSWYCTLHIRNSDWSNCRNTNIEDYDKVIDYIIEQGGQVLLTGNDLTKKNGLPYVPKNSNADLRLFLLAKQKLMIASSSGPVHSSFLFDIPVLLTNNIFWEFFTWSYKDSSLPKMILNKKTDKLLKRSEYMELRKCEKYSMEGLDHGYTAIDNSSNEILTAFKNKLTEMSLANYGCFPKQERFRSAFDESFYIHSTHSKIDNSYYEKYQKIFEN